ncbi:MAG: hypothetical protein H0V89_13715 [Deltaproteobacteria bacterium]|nr:hypothetical protein [Deltaproteobacteria bacterium]
MRFPIFLLLASCAHQPSATQLEAAPSLPAPQGRTFARSPGIPSDPAVARLVAGVRWDTALSGAAGGLGVEASLGAVTYQPWEIREAAWRAGYPFPIRQVRAWATPKAAEPPAELLAWLATVQEGTDLGLVRTRSPEGDTWVALTAAPRISLPPFPREARVSGELRFPVMPGAKLVWTDPVGGFGELDLGSERVVPLHTPGCWLVEVRDAEGVAARFPVWVGMSAPDLRLYDLPDLPTEPGPRAEVLLDEVRALSNRDPWTRDATLDLIAAMRLADSTAALVPALERLGYDASRTGSWSCEATTLEACLDQVLWRPEGRRVVLAPEGVAGFAVDVSSGAVRLLGLVAPE